MDRDTRKMTREVDQISSDLERMNFNIINQNKFTKTLIMDQIIEIQKMLRKNVYEDQNTQSFMQKQINQVKYQEAEIQYTVEELNGRQEKIQTEIGNDDDIWYFQ